MWSNTIWSDGVNNVQWNFRTQRLKLSADDRSNDAECVWTKSNKIFYGINTWSFEGKIYFSAKLILSSFKWDIVLLTSLNTIDQKKKIKEKRLSSLAIFLCLLQRVNLCMRLNKTSFLFSSTDGWKMNQAGQDSTRLRFQMLLTLLVHFFQGKSYFSVILRYAFLF